MDPIHPLDFNQVSRPILDVVGWGETHEDPKDHTLTGSGVYSGYTSEGHALFGVLMPNTPGVPKVLTIIKKPYIL